MAPSAKQIKKTDVLLLGNDLTSRLLARHYLQAGREVTYVDDWFNNSLDSRPRESRVLEFLPNRPETEAVLEWTARLMQRSLTRSSSELEPMTFHEGHFQPFLGFGDAAPLSHEDFLFYTQPSEIRISPPLMELMEPLDSGSGANRLESKRVTKIIAQGEIAVVEFNGDELWAAELLLAPFAPSEILSLIPHEHLDGKLRQRLTKSHQWTSVTLHLTHENQSPHGPNVYLLHGQGREGEPVIGRFFRLSNDSPWTSSWLTLVAARDAELPDPLASALKHIKRQVKRAFPAEMEQPHRERIVVAPSSHGFFELSHSHPHQIKGLKNLIFTNPLQSRFKGPLASLDMAYQIAKIGGEKIPLPLAHAASPEPAAEQGSAL